QRHAGTQLSLPRQQYSAGSRSGVRQRLRRRSGRISRLLCCVDVLRRWFLVWQRLCEWLPDGALQLQLVGWTGQCIAMRGRPCKSDLRGRSGWFSGFLQLSDRKEIAMSDRSIALVVSSVAMLGCSSGQPDGETEGEAAQAATGTYDLAQYVIPSCSTP